MHLMRPSLRVTNRVVHFRLFLHFDFDRKIHERKATFASTCLVDQVQVLDLELVHEKPIKYSVFNCYKIKSNKIIMK